MDSSYVTYISCVVQKPFANTFLEPLSCFPLSQQHHQSGLCNITVYYLFLSSLSFRPYSCLLKEHRKNCKSCHFQDTASSWAQLVAVILCEAQGWATGRAKARVHRYPEPVPILKLGRGFTHSLRLSTTTTALAVPCPHQREMLANCAQRETICSYMAPTFDDIHNLPKR